MTTPTTVPVRRQIINADVLAASMRAYLRDLGLFKIVPDDLPPDVNTTDLPTALVWLGPGTFTSHTTGFTRLRRTVIIRGYVLPVVQGAVVDEGYRATLWLLQAIGNGILEDPTLGHRVTNCGVVTDTGCVAITSPAGLQYWGFETRVPVWIETIPVRGRPGSVIDPVTGLPRDGVPIDPITGLPIIPVGSGAAPLQKAEVAGDVTFEVPGTDTVPETGGEDPP